MLTNGRGDIADKASVEFAEAVASPRRYGPAIETLVRGTRSAHHIELEDVRKHHSDELESIRKHHLLELADLRKSHAETLE